MEEEEDLPTVIYCAAASLGPALPGHPPPDYDESDGGRRAWEAATTFLRAIRNRVGAEPRGARLQVEEYGREGRTALDVVCEYDPGIAAAQMYADRCGELVYRSTDGESWISVVRRADDGRGRE